MNEYFTAITVVVLLDLFLSAILILVFRKRFAQLFNLYVRKVITQVEQERLEDEMAYEEYRRSDEYNESYGE